MERVSIHRHALVHLASRSGVREHATEAYKLVVGVDSDLVVASGAQSIRASVVLVPPNVSQAMRAEGMAVAFFAEPGSPFAPFPGRGGAIVVPDARTSARLRRIATECVLGTAAGDGPALEEAYRALGLEGPRRIDRRVRHALAVAARDTRADLDGIARAENVSSTRLRHLVNEQTGLSLRRHQLWHRTVAATERVLAGASIARAAIDVGFADHPHYSRSFAAFFGRTPSSIAMPATIVRAYASNDG